MRQVFVAALCLAGTGFVSACGDPNAEASRALQSIDLIDEANLADIMLTAANPDDAVAFFRNALAEQPDRVDLRRGLAKSLVRAGRPTEAVVVWREIVQSPEATSEDRVGYAGALIRTNDWAAAKAELERVPPTHETFERYRLEAMIADYNRQWDRSDSFYETAVGLTTRPASVLNNWGFSKLTRGDFAGAERLFTESLRYDPNIFAVKNNLVMARAAQRNYTLPVIPMTQIERAQLLHTMAVAAIRQGDVNTGRSLLQDAVETHPQHFDEAVRALRALESA